MHLKTYERFAAETAQNAGKILLKHFQKKFKVIYKGSGRNNLVTEIDKLSEAFIIKNIKKNFPDHEILSEESGAIEKSAKTRKSGFRWVIDPIDGTNNYAHGHPFFAVSIGLEKDNKIVAGVVYAPVYGELFRASKGCGSFLNDKRIHVSKIKNLDEAILASGFSYVQKERNFPYIEHFALKAQGIRRCGAAALELAYLAAGHQDGFWEFGLQAWDFAAGKILIEEAGGKVTNIEGKPLLLTNHDLIASNGTLHREILQNIDIVKT